MTEWDKLSRMEKLASVMYAGHTDAETRREMASRARAEGKVAPKPAPLLPDHKRGAVSPLGGTARPRQ
jgi:hypothetical protein